MSSPDPSPATAAYAAARRIPGWLTRAQASVLHDAAAGVPPGGHVVEIGTHLGRSAVVLALGARPDVTVTAVDPLEPGWRYGVPDAEARLRANLARAGVADRVRVLVTTSSRARVGWGDPVDLLYVDGKHDYWSLRQDLRWSEHLATGGRVLVHDAFSSLGVTAGLLHECVLRGRLRYLRRTGSLAELAPGPAQPADRLRACASLPWFARNLLVKVLLRLRLRPAAALLGHHGRDDPY